MAEIKYTANRGAPENIPGVEKYSTEDTQLISSFEVNNSFNTAQHYVELHLLSLNDELLFSEYDYKGFRELGNAQSARQEGTSVLTIDPIQDSISYEYSTGGVKLLYHFLNDLFTDNSSEGELYVKEISPDRTELKLASLTISSENLQRFANNVKNRLQNEAFFNEFRLNFRDNDLIIGVNIDTLDVGIEKEIAVKLYEPLPFTYNLKSKLRIVELVADSAAYEISSEIKPEPEVFPTLKSANFNIDIQDENTIPTQYFNYDELFSYPVNNTNSQLFSLVSEKGVEINVDHTLYSDFIHFSSAQERLLNFKYKLDLITSYSSSLAAISTQTVGLQGISGSRTYFEGLIEGVVSNFDHYERFLYYESGSANWPKLNTSKPFINQPSNTAEAILWYSNQLTEAILYDSTNHNSLIFSIPTYLREDENNENYLTFIHMIGQHFDNLWLYADAVTDKYDADNRLNRGISKDLVGEALKNFGVKLYTSNKSIEDLFSSTVGQEYVSGSETIVHYITGSLIDSNIPIEPSSFDNYQKEIQKRIYHNLSYLLKNKGTERGLRALINCFGIPSDILQIKLYGGRNTNERPFYGDYQYSTSSLDKIRIDHTGSMVLGDTLSRYTSIIKRDSKYTDDLHAIEVGFSPTDNVDNYIISKSLSTASLSSFNIDNYLGDPRNMYLDNYYPLSAEGNISGESLDQLTDRIMSGLTTYNVYDFVRLIKFFDNTIFKTVKDFIPARSTIDTGVIIKPHLLQRNKAKSVLLSGLRPEYSGSIDTAFIEGGDGGIFLSATQGTVGNELNTSYVSNVQTPFGIGADSRHAHQEASYDGELNNSKIQVSNGELNSSNIYKTIENVIYPYNINFVSESNEICLLDSAPGTSPFLYITSSTATLASTDFFIYTNASSTYTASVPAVGGTSNTITFPTTIQNLQTIFPEDLVQYSTGSITVNNENYTLGPCISTVNFIYATCSLSLTSIGQDIDSVIASDYEGVLGDYDLTSWFNHHPSQRVKYTITSDSVTTTITNPTTYIFNISLIGSTVIISIKDTGAGPGCILNKAVEVVEFNPEVHGGEEFQYSS